MIAHRAANRGRSARPAAFSAVTVRALIVVALLAGTGCGSGAFRGPAPQSRDSSTRRSTEAVGPEGSATARWGGSASGSTSSEQRDGPARVTYGYSLPEGDTAHADENGVMYSKLFTGRCAEAQAHLDHSWPWGYQSPEEVLMFQVGTSMCAGDKATAAAQFGRGERLYGWAGLATFGRNLCNIYRAYLSYRDQRPQDTVSCPGGRLVFWPGWPEHPNQELRDDPRTDAVETASPVRPGSDESATPGSISDGTEASPGESQPSTPPESGNTATTTPSTSAAETAPTPGRTP